MTTTWLTTLDATGYTLTEATLDGERATASRSDVDSYAMWRTRGHGGIADTIEEAQRKAEEFVARERRRSGGPL